LNAEVDRETSALEREIEQFRLRSLLSGPDDFRDAQLEISAGAGGTEAQDWASMLMRMYTRWAERKGYTIDILDLSDGEEAGIKGAVLEIKGMYAYGFLKAEIACTVSCASLRSTHRRAGIRASRRCSCIPS
jgi:peptide chain release factor 2